MENPLNYENLGIIHFSSSGRYTFKDVSDIVSDINPKKSVMPKVKAFIRGMDKNHVTGLDLVELYKSVGWEEVRPREKAKFEVVRPILEKHPKYGAVVSSPSGYQILFDPSIFDKFNTHYMKVPTSKRILELTETLEEICADTFIPIEVLKKQRIYWEVLSANAYEKRFKGDFLPPSTVALKSGGKEFTFFNKEYWDFLFNKKGKEKFKKIPKPGREFSISELSEEARNYTFKEDSGLTKEEQLDISSKFLTAYRAFKSMEINLGLSIQSIKKLALLMDREHFRSFSYSGNTFTRKGISEILSEASPLEKLMEHYTTIIVHDNKKYINKLVDYYVRFATSLSRQDFFNEIVLGIITALKKFDPSKGYYFLTYARWWMKQKIFEALANSWGVIRLPRHVYWDLIRLSKSGQAFLKENKRYPSNEELAELVSMPVNMVREYKGYKKLINPVSLDAPLHPEESDSPSLISIVNDDDDNEELPRPGMAVQPDFTLGLEEAERKDKLSRWLSTLKPNEEKVLRLRFGIRDGHYGEELTLQEIAGMMQGRKGKTRQRIKQIESDALKKMRDPKLNNNKYYQYFLE